MELQVLMLISSKVRRQHGPDSIDTKQLSGSQMALDRQRNNEGTGLGPSTVGQFLNVTSIFEQEAGAGYRGGGFSGIAPDR